MFDHVMIDVETTGISPDHTAIIQITAIKFDPFAGKIDDYENWFNRCLSIPTTRWWDESTRRWWLTKPETFGSISARMEDPRQVMDDFYWAMGGSNNNLHFWAKPLSFDYPFIQSYLREFGPAQCFDFRKGRDLRSFFAGLSYPDKPFDEKSVEFDGVAHDALWDTLHQIKTVFAAIEASTLGSVVIIGEIEDV